MVKVAIIEASHWHVPLYLDGLSVPEIDVVAVCDRTQTAGHAVADRFQARTYNLLQDLIAREQVDFAFAFGRHCDLAHTAHALIQARIPFAIEKPCGMTTAEVQGLAAAAHAANLYVAVPYIYRVSALYRTIGDLEGGLPSDFTHLSFRFIAGAPQRYADWNCDWMLEPEQSGGGALINLGGHFLDLFRVLTGKTVSHVAAVMSSATHATPIEDFAAVTLQTADGTVGVVEAGYTYPSSPGDQREFSFTARSASHYLRSTDNGLLVRPVGGASDQTRTIPFERETDLYYPVFVAQVLEEWRQGRRPSIGLNEAAEVMKMLQAAYVSARSNGVPVAVG